MEEAQSHQRLLGAAGPEASSAGPGGTMTGRGADGAVRASSAASADSAPPRLLLKLLVDMIASVPAPEGVLVNADKGRCLAICSVAKNVSRRL